MRKYIRTRCLETIRILQEAHCDLDKLLSVGEKEKAEEFLKQCQQVAISLGEMIEGQEGEGTDAVHFLEEYCELAYQIYCDIQAEKMPNPHRMIKKLEKCVHRVTNAVHIFSTQTETVFLPYKASMWDSLESVWKASVKDPDCDAYVIPIPYCDRNPDGSVKEVHYEGGLYPNDVPVTDYQSYDFGVRHPDKIYIHNPYDGYNHVTSVDPFFYSDNLKQYTEELIYIPYFILAEPPENLWKRDPESREKYLKGLENYVLLPGVLNADKTIVQSEAMKKCYVKILTKHFGAETKQEWEKRILGLGSPKVDKVLNTKREDLEVPEDWNRVIRKPDGGTRKLILYNTGLSAMLHNDEQMLKKIKDVFRIFKENREGVALLWRPHPLLEATLDSMRVDLAEEYRAIKKKYLEEGYGIYDDSPDLDRAIILSDAYYGDHSSVVWLYQKTGKPIMIQNPEIIDSLSEEQEPSGDRKE